MKGTHAGKKKLVKDRMPLKENEITNFWSSLLVSLSVKYFKRWLVIKMMK